MLVKLMNSQFILKQIYLTEADLQILMKYDIIFELVGNESMIFTVTCAALKSALKVYKSQLSQVQMDDSTKQLFPSITILYNYLCLTPTMLNFDDIFLELRIKVDILGQFKYIYLPIIEQNRSEALSQRFLQITQENAMLHIQNDSQKRNLEVIYNQTLQQQEKYWSNYKSNCQQHRRLTLELQEMESELIKIGKLIIMHEDGITNSLKNNNRELRQTLKAQKQDRQRRRLVVHTYELSKLSNPKITSLISTNVQSLIDVDLSGCELKSMKFMQIFVNLKQMRLSQNNIKKIDGLFYLNSLSILDLSQNQIQKIQNLERNINLSVLILHSNLLTRIENLFHLHKLQVLSLSSNHIQEIPEEIQFLYSLVELRIINNQLNHLPSQLHSMKAIRVLSILGNPCFVSQHKCSDLIDKLVANKKVMTGCGAF